MTALLRMEGWRGLCRKSGCARISLTPDGLSYGLCDGCAKSGVAGEHRNADLDFRDPLSEGLCLEALT